MTSSRPPVAAAERPTVRRRPWWEVRWRQFRNAPRPVFRAVASSLSVAIALGVIYLVYDVALSRGADLPGGDLRTARSGGLRGDRARRRDGDHLPGRAAAAARRGGRGDGFRAQRLERGARILRGGADRLHRAGGRRPGAQAAAHVAPCPVPRRTRFGPARARFTPSVPFPDSRSACGSFDRRGARPSRAHRRPVRVRTRPQRVDRNDSFPRLYGAPGTFRPPKVLDDAPRPSDPDDLPLQYDRSGTDPDAEGISPRPYRHGARPPEPTHVEEDEGELRPASVGLRGLALAVAERAHVAAGSRVPEARGPGCSIGRGGGVAQRLERSSYTRLVPGSNPGSPTSGIRRLSSGGVRPHPAVRDASAGSRRRRRIGSRWSATSSPRCPTASSCSRTASSRPAARRRPHRWARCGARRGWRR